MYTAFLAFRRKKILQQSQVRPLKLNAVKDRMNVLGEVNMNPNTCCTISANSAKFSTAWHAFSLMLHLWILKVYYNNNKWGNEPTRPTRRVLTVYRKKGERERDIISSAICGSQSAAHSKKSTHAFYYFLQACDF